MSTGKLLKGSNQEFCKIATPLDVRRYVRECVSKSLHHQRKELLEELEREISELDLGLVKEKFTPDQLQNEVLKIINSKK